MGGLVSRTLPDFFNTLWELERPDVNVLGKRVCHVEEQRLKILLTKFLGDEGLNCRILVSCIEDLGEAGERPLNTFKKTYLL